MFRECDINNLPLRISLSIMLKFFKILAYFSGMVLMSCLFLIIIWEYEDWKKEFYLPDEESYCNYLRTTNERASELSVRLASIKSRAEADAAVYDIAYLARKNKDAEQEMKSRKIQRPEADECVNSFSVYEEKATREDSYQHLIREYKRLEAQHFYGSQALEYFLKSYFLIKTEHGMMCAWHLTTAYRIATDQYDRELELMNEINVQIETGKSWASGKLQALHESNDKNVTLLVLDALKKNELTYNEYQAFEPLYHSVSGNSALFHNCFCSYYCFSCSNTCGKSRELPVNVDWATCTPADILHLSRTDAMKRADVYTIRPQPSGTAVVFRLAKPFKSKYLSIIYDKDEERAKRMKIGDYPYIVPPITETGATREFLVAQLDELVRVYDKESADKAAEKISELKKRLPFPTANSSESNHHSEIKRLIEAQFYGSEALEKEVLGRGGC